MKKVKTHQTMEERLNAIRAGVLGSNDGILTVVGVLFSVGAATTNQFTILIAGLADLLACALSMASGEYASVSSQADAEKVVVDLETQRLRVDPDGVATDIRQFYLDRGVSEATAAEIATELMAKSPLERFYRRNIMCNWATMSVLGLRRFHHCSVQRLVGHSHC